MSFFPSRRVCLVMIHDAIATALAVVLAFYLRFDAAGLTLRLPMLTWFLPIYVLCAGGVYSFFHLYRSKWRFASLPDLFNIFCASTVLALVLLTYDYLLASSPFYATFFFGKITLFLYWLLQMFALGAARLAYRYFRYAQDRIMPKGASAINALLAGSLAEAEAALRVLETTARHNLRVTGILSNEARDRGDRVRATAVMGVPGDLERVVFDLDLNQQRPQRLILLPSVFHDSTVVEKLVSDARRLALTTQRFTQLQPLAEPVVRAPQFTAVETEDLLFRDSVPIDQAQLKLLVRGKKIAITGAAGSIGSVICLRLASLEAGELLILDHSEAGLYTISNQLRALAPDVPVQAHLADIRDEKRVMSVIGAFKPALVFHAGALKHVPMTEKDWDEAIRTNVMGTVHVCKAAKACGAQALVNISTDKAVEPVSVLGATKRFGELYVSALDAADTGTRFISVRFGNVLGSSGSVVPLFKKQIEAGGPLTVTHAAMVRYFMTASEACNLVLTAAAHAAHDTARAVTVYVLDMGQPVRILDLAERMIRLAGLQPGKDIETIITGPRPGERVHEMLFGKGEKVLSTHCPGLSAAAVDINDLLVLEDKAQALLDAAENHDRATALRLLQNIVPDYYPSAL